MREPLSPSFQCVRARLCYWSLTPFGESESARRTSDASRLTGHLQAPSGSETELEREEQDVERPASAAATELRLGARLKVRSLIDALGLVDLAVLFGVGLPLTAGLLQVDVEFSGWQAHVFRGAGLVVEHPDDRAGRQLITASDAAQIGREDVEFLSIDRRVLRVLQIQLHVLRLRGDRRCARTAPSLLLHLRGEGEEGNEQRG